MPIKIIDFFSSLKIQGSELVFMIGIFEILVATSLLTNIFVSIFSVLAVLFLAGIFIFHGVSEVLIRDIGLIGGLLSIFFWPRSRNSGRF